MPRLTTAGRKIAEHLGLDGDTFEEDYRYQSTRWTKPVYAIGNDYWCAGPKPAKATMEAYDFDEPWERVVSSFDGTSVLWVQRNP